MVQVSKKYEEFKNKVKEDLNKIFTPDIDGF